jgi:glycosyltransferase involved in cell wall biosynthesis
MVVVVTPQMLELGALRRIATTRRRAIENGIPSLATRLSDVAARGAASLPAEVVEFTARRPTLIAIGRLRPDKGFLLLLEAFAQAREQRAESQLLIVGDGPQRQILAERIASLQLGNDVRLAGYLDGADRLLSGAAGFVMSSVTEGMPLVLLEAMQWQVPILATAVGAIPELLENGRLGILVPPNDLSGLTRGLGTILSSRFESKGITDATHREASRRFSSSRMAEEYLAAYRLATGQGSSRPENGAHTRYVC